MYNSSSVFKSSPGFSRFSVLACAVLLLVATACQDPVDPALEIAEVDLGETEVLTFSESAAVVDLLEGVESDEATDVQLTDQAKSGAITLTDDNLAIFEPNTDFVTGDTRFCVRFTAGDRRYIRCFRIRMLRDSISRRCDVIFRPDRFVVQAGTRDTLNVLRNDVIRRCAPGATIDRMAIHGPRLGQATLTSNYRVDYAPPQGYTGRDYLIYYVKLSNGRIGRAVTWILVE